MSPSFTEVVPHCTSDDVTYFRFETTFTMIPADQDIENRCPVWRALSDLFLDTELQDHDLSCIARFLAESPYTFAEIETILFRELYPVCIPNLLCVAGDWAGFNEAWLEASILKHARRRWTLKNILQLNRWMIRDDWNRVKDLYHVQRGVADTHADELETFPDLL